MTRHPQMIQHTDTSKGLSVNINGHDVSVDGPPPPKDWWCEPCLSGQCQGCDGTAYNVEEDVMTTCGHDHAVPYVPRETP